MTRERILREASFAGVLICMAGMVTSPALLSIGMVVIIVSGCFLYPIPQQFQRFWQHKPAVFFALLFLLEVMAGLWTRELAREEWLENLKIKAPLFLGMYALAVRGPFTFNQVRIALMVLLGSTFVVGTGTVMDYFLNRAEVEHRIQISKEVEVWLGTNHIYFSIVMAFAILGGIWMLLQRGPVIFRGGRIVVIVLVVLCFLEMHVLTTRTGLVGLYLTGLILGWIELLKRRRFLLALVLAVGLASMPFIGYHTVDPFKHRIDNTIMDVGEYLQGKDPNYLSIGTRIESWKTAFHLWKKHPLIGVANADLEADMTDQYVEDKTALCPENFVQPHNQFLQYLAGMGLLGFVLLCLAWFYPVFSKAWNKDLLFWMFWLNYTFAMLGESTMERQIGVGFLVVGFMLTLGINRPLPYTPPYESGESLG